MNPGLDLETANNEEFRYPDPDTTKVESPHLQRVHVLIPMLNSSVLNVIPGHELVGEGLSAEDVDGPGVVVGDEAAAAGALLRLVLLSQTLPRAQAAATARGGRGGQERLVVLRPQGLKCQ